MTLTKLIPLTAGLLVAMTAAASAHSTKPIDHALARQASIIEHGRRTGDITWTEGRKLRAEQREIARMRDYFLQDGNLTGREYRALRARQKEARVHIRSEANDRRRRIWWLPRVGR